ncbi:complement C1s-B subcomponent isoform X2 [Callorhinchus milii]|uniref:complement C1s-B subcomponent isoform X2 n=1 Tax=Callorhinchus milii TaxID=7868 RepID=UPI001C3F6183|nr:complement C1s-B subcomponent isoform X2 [Callorhinchus milii]
MDFRFPQRWFYALLWAEVLPIALSATVPLSGEIRSHISHSGHRRTWTVRVPPGLGVRLHITHFESLSSATCVRDYVEIFADRHRLGRFCGNGTSVRFHSPNTGRGGSDSSELRIQAHFTTSHPDSRRGFVLYYQAVDIDECAAVSESPCDHHCHNYIGGFVCRCQHGYHLLPDARTCDVVDCGSPSSIENGQFTFLTEPGTWWKSRITFTCDSEYYSLSSPENGMYECKANGKWMNQERGDRLPTLCGLPRSPPALVQRIVGGSPAARGSFPWHVHLQTVVCGGALLTDLWLLTSAACVEPAAVVRVWAGGVEQSRWEEWTMAESAQIHIHPGFSRSAGLSQRHGFQHDLALVRLRNRLPIGPFLSPVCLPGRDPRFALAPGRVGFVPGFGETDQWAESERLMFTAVPVVGSEVCSQRAAGQQIPALTKNMLCAGPEPGRGGGDTCQGDGGGAYVFQDPQQIGRFYVAGVVSWGFECGSYSVYTDVSKYLDWIEDIMSGNETEI